MKIFRLEHQHKWHIVDPRDHNHSLCRENYNANPQVAETKEYADEKLCNICQSRGYKRGYLGVYPKVSIEGVHNPKRYVELDNYNIRDFMEETVYSHPNKVETRYKPEKNWKETLSPNRTNEITNQEGSLTNRFIGFLMENLKGKEYGKWTRDELKRELLDKTKHTYKEKDFWLEKFLNHTDIDDFTQVPKLLAKYYAKSVNGKKLIKANKELKVIYLWNRDKDGRAIATNLIYGYEIAPYDSIDGDINLPIAFGNFGEG